MTFPVPDNPALVKNPDIYAAVYDFVKQYAVPAIPPDNIFRGWRNRSTLPPASNEFSIISIISQERRGTDVEDYVAADSGGVLTLYELVLCRIQLDFYSGDDNFARQRAQAIETVARSTVGPQFFRQNYGIGCNFASNPRQIPEFDGSKQFVSRWMTELQLSYMWAIGLSLPWFDTVTVDRVEDVDAHHKPK